MQYWLFKTEPSTYSIDDLRRDTKTAWTGVRNYQARNLLRDEVKKGDTVLFYHSSCAVPAVVGEAVVLKEGYPDATQYDPHSVYFDPKADKAHPRWYAVDIRYRKKLPRPVPLALMRSLPELQGMRLLAPGNRLSLFPITQKEYEVIVSLGAI